MRRHLVAMLACLLFFGCDSRGSGAGNSSPKPALEIMQDGSQRLATEAGEIRFRIIRQASTEASSRPALIIGLHGYGADERQIETLVNVEPSVRHTFVALRAPLSLPGRGFTITARTTACCSDCSILQFALAGVRGPPGREETFVCGIDYNPNTDSSTRPSPPPRSNSIGQRNWK